MAFNNTSKAEKNCQWHFIKRNSNDNGVGPNEPMSENFRKTPYASLVREAIQNSLDVVKDNSQPMEIRFSIGSIDSNNFANFFDLRKHIQGCIDNFPNNDKAKKTYSPMLAYLDKVQRLGEKLYFIRISDHNTRGMHYDNPENNDSPFYAFVRSAGVSSKADESAGGSFGFGKAAYFYLSPIRTILVSTKTEDNKYYFEGVASLCSHKIDGHTVSNIVYYDNNGGTPTTDYANIPARFQRKDSEGHELGAGTDIFIMGVDFINYGNEEEIYNQMYESVLENFWLAILKNQLIVKIGKDNERVINGSNIADVMNQMFEEHDSHKRKNYNPRPYFDAVNLANTSDKYIYRTINLNNIPDLTNIDAHCDWGHVHYYFHKNKYAPNRIVYMRGLKMKVYISAACPGAGYYGVIVCPNGKCNAILRQTEGPAHDEWKTARLENKGEKEVAKTLLRIIDAQKNSIIREIFKLDEIETIKIRGLEQYLYISTEVDEVDEDGGISSTIGVPTGTYLDDGYSPTTIGSGIRNNPLPSSEILVGKVLMHQSGQVTPDLQGNFLTGRGNTKIKNPNTNDYISAAKPKQRNAFHENGHKSHILEPVAVNYRSFAQRVGNAIVHKIIIHAPYEIANGQIDLLVGGESSDSKITIADATKGNIQGNSIVNLEFVKGKNEIVIHFADNLRHSIKLEAYEIK